MDSWVYCVRLVLLPLQSRCHCFRLMRRPALHAIIGLLRLAYSLCQSRFTPTWSWGGSALHFYVPWRHMFLTIPRGWRNLTHFRRFIWTLLELILNLLSRAFDTLLRSLRQHADIMPEDLGAKSPGIGLWLRMDLQSAYAGSRDFGAERPFLSDMHPVPF